MKGILPFTYFICMLLLFGYELKAESATSKDGDVKLECLLRREAIWQGAASMVLENNIICEFNTQVSISNLVTNGYVKYPYDRCPSGCIYPSIFEMGPGPKCPMHIIEGELNVFGVIRKKYLKKERTIQEICGLVSPTNSTAAQAMGYHWLPGAMVTDPMYKKEDFPRIANMIAQGLTNNNDVVRASALRTARQFKLAPRISGGD